MLKHDSQEFSIEIPDAEADEIQTVQQGVFSALEMLLREDNDGLFISNRLHC